MCCVGAGSGIGQLMSIDFAKRGATIVAWDINKQGNQETARLIKTVGGAVHTYICDVRLVKQHTPTYSTWWQLAEFQTVQTHAHLWYIHFQSTYIIPQTTGTYWE